MDGRPSLRSVPSNSSNNSAYGDPFAGGRHAQFVEPERPYRNQQGFESTASIPQEFGGRDYDEDEFLEKQPLTANQYPGGFYPPYVL